MSLCSVNAPPRAPVPRAPLAPRVAFAPLSLMLHAAVQHWPPKSPQGTQRPRSTAALLGLPGALASLFADTQSGDEASASLGVGCGWVYGWVGGGLAAGECGGSN